MYTFLLMTAMSSSPQTAEFNGFFRDLFSFGGCKGSCQGSCYGSCRGVSSGCYGSTSNSCNGFGSRMRAFFSGSSCYGSCSGRSAGCAGSCYGSCQGSGYGCAGGFAPMPMGPDGYAAPLPAGASSPGFEYMPATPVPAIPQSVPDSRQRISLTGPAAGDRATVVVRLPADAKLFAEGRQLTLASAERTFVTPPLQTGPDYSYTFRAEYVRDGETIARSKTVAVKPGVIATVEFTEGVAKAEPRKPEPMPAKPTAAPKVPTLPSAADRARITVKLPPGATLYVDGKKNDRTEPVREFNTPPLPAGQEFAYLMKAEQMRDGRPESTTTKVSFRAGEIVTVDLTAPAK